jgi:hypothetical protein
LILIGCCIYQAIAATPATEPSDKPESTSPHSRINKMDSAGPTIQDYSKEGFVIEKFSKTITFAGDGTWQREQTAVIRVQSEAAVRIFGVLGFPYNSENEHVEFVYVRVKKKDGSVIATPDSNVLDISSEVTRVAPMYTDLRQKQIPVKALGVGDVLEYSVRTVQSKPEIAGQFWYSQDFLTDAVVLEEELTIRFPAAKYVKVDSPTVKPKIYDDQGQKTYLWRTSQTRTLAAGGNLKEPKVGGTRHTSGATHDIPDLGRSRPMVSRLGIVACACHACREGQSG